MTTDRMPSDDGLPRAGSVPPPTAGWPIYNCGPHGFAVACPPMAPGPLSGFAWRWICVSRPGDPTTPTTELRMSDEHPTMPEPPITTDAELDAAIGAINRLLDRDDLSPAELDRLDAMGDRVHAYESARWPDEAVSDADLLRHLIEARGVTQATLAADAGISESTVSAVLAGTRRLNRGHIARLAAYFQVSPAVFFPGRPKETEHAAEKLEKALVSGNQVLFSRRDGVRPIGPVRREQAAWEARVATEDLIGRWKSGEAPDESLWDFLGMTIDELTNFAVREKLPEGYRPPDRPKPAR